jgi:hypothetical protein
MNGTMGNGMILEAGYVDYFDCSGFLTIKESEDWVDVGMDFTITEEGTEETYLYSFSNSPNEEGFYAYYSYLR